MLAQLCSADTQFVDGWLELMSAGAESDTNYRVPGTAFTYRWILL